MSAFITRLIDMSLAGGILILLAVILRLVFRRAPKRAALLLWAVVALRLLCPVFINGGFAVMPRVDDIAGKLAVNGEPTGSEPAFETALPTQAAPIGSVEATGSAITPAQTSSAEHPSVTAPPTSTAVPIVPAVKTEPAPLPTQKASVPAAARTGSWQKAAFFVWLAGAVCMFCYAMISFARLKSRLSTAIRLRDNVYQSEYVSSPFLLGVLHPRIYVPFGLEGESLEFALAHERAHISRGDHILKLIGFAVLSLHWFNPLCWLGYALFCRDIELACDERVTASFTESERAGYSNALLELSSGKAAISACPLTFGEVGVGARIKRVLSHKKPLVWLVPVCLSVCLLLAGCSLFGGKSDPPSGSPAPTETVAAEPTEEPTAEPTEEKDVLKKLARSKGWAYVDRSYTMTEGIAVWKAFFRDVDNGVPSCVTVLTEISLKKAAGSSSGTWEKAPASAYRIELEHLNSGLKVSSMDMSAYLEDPSAGFTEEFIVDDPTEYGLLEHFFITGSAYDGEPGIYHMYALMNAYYDADERVAETPYDLPGDIHPLFLVEAPYQTGIEFADPAFEACVRKQLGIPEGVPINPSLISSAERLNLDGADLRSLEDLKHFSSVTWIVLRNAPNVDISVLAECTRLEKLWITDCGLTDLKFLSGLTGLRELYFNGTEITDLSPLAYLKKLEQLMIFSCGAEDLTPLSELPLHQLYISNMPGADLTPISQLEYLEDLSVRTCGLTEISFVSGLHGLRSLDISDNYVEDISPVTSNESLTSLTADNNLISDISPLMGMEHLYWADLSFNKVDPADAEALLAYMKDGRTYSSDASVSIYPGDRSDLICWPVDLDGDGEDEYFYADLGLMQNDFISFVWLENKDHYRLSEQFYCGTGHVAFGSFALVESPEYGRCIMSTTSLNYGIYGYSLMTLVDGKLQTVYSETFYNSDDDNAHFDSEAAAEYEERINTLYASGQLLVTTDRWNGLMRQEFLPDGKTVDIDYNDTLAVICAYGSTGTGIDNVRAGENASHFVIFDRRNYSRVTVEPFTGQ